VSGRETARVSDDILDPDGAFGELGAWKGGIDRLAAATRVMSDRLGALRVTASDEHDTVEVAIDASGALTGLQLGGRSRLVPPDELAGAIMRTIRAARGTVADRAQEIIAATVGTDGPGRALAARVDRRMRGGFDE
jgi:hypothetical protein